MRFSAKYGPLDLGEAPLDFDAEMIKPVEQRHIILRWRHERSELLKELIKNPEKTLINCCSSNDRKY